MTAASTIRERAPTARPESPPPAPAEPHGPHPVADAPWYYVADGEIAGPLTVAGLAPLFGERAISAESLVWQKGMRRWLPVDRIPDLKRALERG